MAADGTGVVLRGSPGHRHWYRTTSSGKAKTVCGKLIDCGGAKGWARPPGLGLELESRAGYSGERLA